MALRELPSIGDICRLIATPPRGTFCVVQSQRRYASAGAVAKQESVGQDELSDLEPQSSFSSNGTESERVAQFDPVRTSKKRQGRLPPSRCVYDVSTSTNSANQS
jgi:hypothetical protein